MGIGAKSRQFTPDPNSRPPGRQPGIAPADPRLMADNKIPQVAGTATGRELQPGHRETWEDIKKNVKAGRGQKYLEPGPDRDNAIRLSRSRMPEGGYETVKHSWLGALPGATIEGLGETVAELKGGVKTAAGFGGKAVVLIVLAGLAFWALGGAKVATAAASKSVTIG